MSQSSISPLVLIGYEKYIEVAGRSLLLEPSWYCLL